MDSICLAVAKREFAELNRARQNPGAYGREIRIKLDHFPALPPLQWDSALSKIAQMKAEDMLRHKYFGHEDPWKRHIGWYVLRSGYPLANPFRYLEEEGTHVLESCAGNISTNPKDTQWTHHRYVKFLIYENGAPDEEASHRLHLLGKGVVLNGTAFSGHQVGIGVAPGHVVILIADREN